jgi:hypothetical protein
VVVVVQLREELGGRKEKIGEERGGGFYINA